MTPAHGKLAMGATFLLACGAVFIPTTPPTPATAADPPVAQKPMAAKPSDTTSEVEDRPAPQSIFAGTAIGFVLEANGNEVPKNGQQMMKALSEFGEFAQLPVTFSAVDLHTRLNQPRVIITKRPSMSQPNQPALVGGKLVGKLPPANPFGLLGVGAGTLNTQASISTNSLTKPNLEGRLFLAANMEKKDSGGYRVKTFEFISWNSHKQQFDFGFIECDDVEPQIRVVDGVKCFTCHKNRGPILGQGPWSNTPHNDRLREAVATSMGVNLPALCLPNTIGQPQSLSTGFDLVVAAKQPNTTQDGVAVLIPQGPAVDAAVRMGSDLARDRNVYRELVRNPDGRKAMAILLAAIATAGPLEQNQQHVRAAIDQIFTTNYSTFAEKWVTYHKNSSSTLVDFNPSGSLGTLRQVTTGSLGGWGGGSTLQTNLQVVWSGDNKQINDYDTKRATDEHGLPSNRQPSNPKAFVRPTVGMPGKPSAALSTVQLARLIGLTEGDREFMADQLSSAVQQIGKPKVTATTLARDVFAGPQFLELFTAGEVPDREDFKDRFVKGLNALLKSHNMNELKLTRADYASGPNVGRIPGKQDEEIPVVATTTCIRCHDVRGVGKPGFNPIPMLAFDPFDQNSRDRWVKTTPTKVRLPILARMLKRVDTDRDMPPEDSPEFDAFRTKEPATLDAMKDWLTAELKKAKSE